MFQTLIWNPISLALLGGQHWVKTSVWHRPRWCLIFCRIGDDLNQVWFTCFKLLLIPHLALTIEGTLKHWIHRSFERTQSSHPHVHLYRGSKLFKWIRYFKTFKYRKDTSCWDGTDYLRVKQIVWYIHITTCPYGPSCIPTRFLRQSQLVYSHQISQTISTR